MEDLGKRFAYKPATPLTWAMEHEGVERGLLATDADDPERLALNDRGNEKQNYRMNRADQIETIKHLFYRHLSHHGVGAISPAS
jgi:hypothetical protein